MVCTVCFPVMYFVAGDVLVLLLLVVVILPVVVVLLQGEPEVLDAVAESVNVFSVYFNNSAVKLRTNH